jgi:hypothetical protein
MNRSKGSSVLFALGVSAVLWLALTLLTGVPASAEGDSVLFATPNGTGTVCSRAAPCSISAAVNKAASGDSVYLGAGTYHGSGGAVISITKSLALLCGWNGSSTAGVIRDPAAYRSVIDGQGQRRGIFISTTGPVGVDGCVIIRGTASMAPNKGAGGGIYSADAVPLLMNNVITACTASLATGSNGVGGGVFVANASGGYISHNWLQDNWASASGSGHGGAIALSQVRHVTLDQNTLLHNAGSITNGLGYGGGLYIEQSSDVLISANEFRNNAAQVGYCAATLGSFGGGVLFGLSDHITLTNNLFFDNHASLTSRGTGGALAFSMAGYVLVRHNQIDSNTASNGSGQVRGDGGGIAVEYCHQLAIEQNTIVRNQASASFMGFGGAIHLGGATHFTLTNNLIADNNASREGGGLSFESDVNEPVTGTLLHNTFARNTSGSGSGQDAIHAEMAEVHLTGMNNLFYFHRYAVFGGAGAAITLTRSLYFGNTLADTGGGGVVDISPIRGADPLLKSNLRLRTGSPAIDAGVNAGVTVDLDGDPRPMGSAPDIGADEATVTVLRVYLPVLGKAQRP